MVMTSCICVVCYAARIPRARPTTTKLFSFSKRYVSPAVPTRLAARRDQIVDIFSDDFPSYGLDPEDILEDLKEETETTPKEFIVNLTRRGEGWGEEVMPCVTIEWRQLNKSDRIRYRCQGPLAWQEGSVECVLLRAGVPKDYVEKVVVAASSWRVTPCGRPLVDRRRRSRVQRNVNLVIDYLVNVCGVPMGPDGVGKILVKSPQLLLAKATAADRWSARVLELAAYMHLHGNINVPKNWKVSPTLGRWVQRQHQLYVEGELKGERLQILYALGFQFVQRYSFDYRSWESQFDPYADWIIKLREGRDRVSDESELDWFMLGGWPAAKLAVWGIYQRQLYLKKRLPPNVIQRLNYFGFQWDYDPKHRNWLTNFGELVYVVQEHKPVDRTELLSSAEEINYPARTKEDIMEDEQFIAFCSAVQPHRSVNEEKKSTPEISAEQGLPRLERINIRSTHPAAQQWLQRQQFLWRRGRLLTEQTALFYALGVDLNPFSDKEWMELALSAAKHMLNYHIELEKEFQTAMDETIMRQQPYLLLMPDDIISVSVRGEVVEHVDLTTFCAVRDEVNLIAIEPALAVTSVATEQRPNAVPDPSLDEQPENVYDEGTAYSVREWVLTQRALLKERRLTTSQTHYLAALGLTWVLKDHIVEIDDATWQRYLNELQLRPSTNYLPLKLKQFLVYLRGLYRIGWLPEKRLDALNAIGVDLEFKKRTTSDRLWDKNVSIILNRHRTSQSDEIDADVKLWLKKQEQMINRLTPIRALQLRTLLEHFL